MRKLTIFTIAALASAGISAGGSIAIAGDHKDSEKSDEKIELIGEPKNCIRASSIRSTNIIDDQTIDFKLAGGKVYRSKLHRKCSGLAFEERISYRVRGGNLCHVDIINVLHSFSGGFQEGAACSLGKFQQIKKVKTR